MLCSGARGARAPDNRLQRLVDASPLWIQTRACAT